MPLSWARLLTNKDETIKMKLLTNKDETIKMKLLTNER